MHGREARTTGSRAPGRVTAGCYELQTFLQGGLGGCIFIVRSFMHFHFSIVRIVFKSRAIVVTGLLKRLEMEAFAQ